MNLKLYRFDLLELDGKKVKGGSTYKIWAIDALSATDGMLRDVLIPHKVRAKFSLTREVVVDGNEVNFWEAYLYVKMTEKRVGVSIGIEWIWDKRNLVRV